MQYSVQIVSKNPARHSSKGFILEDGIQIASFERKAATGPYINDMTLKFFTEASKARFCDFSDSLSMVETVEALGG